MSDSPGLIEALEPVARVLQALEVRFYIGGSVASSFHGASRSTLDVDLVAGGTNEFRVIGSYGTLSGAFAQVTGLAPGTKLDYSHGPQQNQIAIVDVGVLLLIK